MRPLVLLILISLAANSAYSQKLHAVSAEYTYYAPETMSVAEAKRVALERAKIEAISNEFGSMVSRSNSTMTVNRNGKSEMTFVSHGGSDIKGEWIETIGEPQIDVSYRDRFLVVTCSVKGKAREIVAPRIDFIAKTLRNGTSLKYESTEFRDGDDLYLYFQSPVAGYLMVYLLQGDNAYCLLPYRRCNGAAYNIEANKPYILFSKKDDANALVDEYQLFVESDVDFASIVVVFSKNEMNPPILEHYASEEPFCISKAEFKAWSTGSRQRGLGILNKIIDIELIKEDQ